MAAPAAGEVDRKVFESEIPVDRVVTLCNGGEDVHITGTEHWVRTEIVTKTGGEHVNWKGEWDVTAVGLTSGDEYKVQYSLHQVANGKAPLAPPTSQVFTHRVTPRVGNGPHAYVETDHDTIVLDFETGALKVFNLRLTSSC